jgi:hypothetical protein
MKRPWLAAVLNFFLMGPGTIYNGRRRALGIGLTIGAIILSWLEFQLQGVAPSLYPIMFGTIFFMNIFFAYDGYTEAQAINASQMVEASA